MGGQNAVLVAVYFSSWFLLLKSFSCSGSSHFCCDCFLSCFLILCGFCCSGFLLFLVFLSSLCISIFLSFCLFFFLYLSSSTCLSFLSSLLSYFHCSSGFLLLLPSSCVSLSAFVLFPLSAVVLFLQLFSFLFLPFLLFLFLPFISSTPIENCLCNLIEGFSLVWNQTWFILLYVFSKLFYVVVCCSQNFICELVIVSLRVRNAKSFEVRHAKP